MNETNKTIIKKVERLRKKYNKMSLLFYELELVLKAKARKNAPPKELKEIIKGLDFNKIEDLSKCSLSLSKFGIGSFRRCVASSFRAPPPIGVPIASIHARTQEQFNTETMLSTVHLLLSDQIVDKMKGSEVNNEANTDLATECNRYVAWMDRIYRFSRGKAREWAEEALLGNTVLKYFDLDHL